MTVSVSAIDLLTSETPVWNGLINISQSAKQRTVIYVGVWILGTAQQRNGRSAFYLLFVPETAQLLKHCQHDL